VSTQVTLLKVVVITILLVGDEAGTAITTGDEKRCSWAINSLKTAIDAGYNVAIGYRALETLNRGGEGYSVAIGKDAGRLISTGVANTIIHNVSVRICRALSSRCYKVITLQR
jgi:hypothetical protein